MGLIHASSRLISADSDSFHILPNDSFQGSLFRAVCLLQRTAIYKAVKGPAHPSQNPLSQEANRYFQVKRYPETIRNNPAAPYATGLKL